MADLSIANVLTRAMSARSAAGTGAKSAGYWASRIVGLVSDSDSSLWSSFGRLSTASGAIVTVDKALQLSTVWACVRLLSETIATLPLAFFERTKSDDRAPAGEHPLAPLLRYQPNADMTAVTFWEAVLASLLLRGNAYIELIVSSKTIVALNFLLPGRMVSRRLPTGAIEYRYTPEYGPARVIPENRMMHIPAFTLNGVFGLSPVAYGAQIFGAATAANDAAGSTFKNGLQPTMYWKTDKILTKSQRAEVRESMSEVTGSMNAGKPPVLEGGMSAGEIGINPNDAQLLESRAFGVEEICRWFRTPPHMVGHTTNSTSWGTGIEQQNIGFLIYALRPWLIRIQQAVRKSLLAPAERDRYYAEFNLDALLMADSAGRSALFSTYAQNGVMTRDEIRKKENMPARGGNADVLTVQTNLAPIDKLGAGTDSQAARSALLNWLRPEESHDRDA